MRGIHLGPVERCTKLCPLSLDAQHVQIINICLFNNVRVCMYVLMYVCMYLCMYVFFIFEYILLCMYVCIYVCIDVCIFNI